MRLLSPRNDTQKSHRNSTSALSLRVGSNLAAGFPLSLARSSPLRVLIPHISGLHTPGHRETLKTGGRAVQRGLEMRDNFVAPVERSVAPRRS